MIITVVMNLIYTLSMLNNHVKIALCEINYYCKMLYFFGNTKQHLLVLPYCYLIILGY